MMFFALFLVCLAVLATQLQAMPPVSVVANVRGKKYEVTAETVEQFSAEVQTLTDIPADQQSVLFRGKVLSPTDKLEDVGVSAGEVLNVVKGRKAFKPAASMTPSSSEDDMLSSGKPSTDEEMLKNLKMDPEKMKQMQQKIEQALDSEEMMSYFDDEEKMEQSRLETLANLDKYEKMMPGFSDKVREMAEDPVKWKEAMTQAKQQIMQLKNLKKSGGPLPGAQSPLFTPSEAPTPDGSVDDIADEDN